MVYITIDIFLIILFKQSKKYKFNQFEKNQIIYVRLSSYIDRYFMIILLTVNTYLFFITFN